MPFLAHVRLPVVWRRHTTRGPDDLEGWAQLCPDCVGKAGDNGFLRFRLHQALAERGAASRGAPTTGEPATASAGPAVDLDREMIEYYEARAPEYDDWYLRRGRYAHGPIHDAAWDAELDAAGRWLDGLPMTGEIVELAAGTGWWSPLAGREGRRIAVRRERSAAGPRPGAAGGARTPGASPRPRCVGRAGPSGRCPVHGLLAQHVPTDRLAEFLAAGPVVAEARRPVRVHRLAG